MLDLTRYAAACAFALLAASGVAADERTRPVVAVSVPPHAVLVERLAGGYVDVALMLPPGASPTHYEPGLRERARLAEAALYVKVGHPHFPFEAAWLDPLLEEAEGLVIIDAAAGATLDEHDPHWWLSPPLARHAAATIAGALSTLVPDARREIEQRLAALDLELAALDRELAERLAAHRGKRFLVFHPAWGHFAERYGLEQIAIEHEHKEPGLAQLARLVELARESGIRHVIVQPQLAPASAQVIAAEIGARVVVADPLSRAWPGELRRITALVTGASPDADDTQASTR